MKSERRQCNTFCFRNEAIPLLYLISPVYGREKELFSHSAPLHFRCYSSVLNYRGSNKEDGVARQHKFLKVEGVTIKWPSWQAIVLGEWGVFKLCK